MYVFARGPASQGDSNIELPADAAEMGCLRRIAALARFISPRAFEKIWWMQAADSPLATHIHQFSLPSFFISAFD
jgi:hypothetical protein